MREGRRSTSIVAGLGTLGVGVAVTAALADAPHEVIGESVVLSGRLAAPLVCPHDPSRVAFQLIGGLERLYVVDEDDPSRTPALVSSVGDDEDTASPTVFDGQADWMPVADRSGRAWIVFSGSGRYNNRDIYLTYAGAPAAWRLTDDPEPDLTPRFSPDGDRIVFVSVRSGSGDVYVIDDVGALRKAILDGSPYAPERNVSRLTDNPGRDLFPSIDAGGRFVVYGQFGRSDREATTEANMGLAVVDLENRDDPPVRLTIDAVQESRPTWSPDGNRIAFYSSRYVEDARVDIGVIQVVYDEGSGRPMLGRLVETGVGREVATNVVPEETRGPMWIPGDAGSHARSLIYVRVSATGEKRLVVADIGRWESGDPNFEYDLLSGTVSNAIDAAWGGTGTVVFAGQTESRYGLFRVDVPDALSAPRGSFPRETIVDEVSRKRWQWIAAGGAAAAALWLLSDTGSSSSDGESPVAGDIADPPCPPGVDC